MGQVLRPYQVEAVAAIFGKFEVNRSTVLVLPTGMGKTTTFSSLADQWLGERRGGRVLVLAHREELIQQAAERLRSFGLNVGIEMGGERVSPMFMPDVVVATVQTMGRASRREAFRPDAFGLIVCDECHLSTATQYLAVFAYFSSAKVLGVTATPDRKGMGQVYESIAYAVDIRDAIRDGYLCPIRQKSVQVDGLDLSQIRTTNGDLNEGELEQVLVEEENLHGVAKPLIELAGERITMVFTATVAHAHALAKVMDRYLQAQGRAGQVVALDGESEKEQRREALRRFKAGETQFLLNCMLFVAGFDAPAISCVAMARPTKSRIFYTQAIGRGTRPLPGKDLLVLDFEGNAGRHSLVTALDVLDGNDDEDVRRRAKEYAAEGDDLLTALDRASNAVAEEKRKKVLAAARYTAVNVDPFQVLGADPRPGRRGGMPPSPAQLEILERKGIPWQGIDAGQAASLIEAAHRRQREGLCTFKQAKLLAKKGLNPDLTFEEAGKALDALAAAGWRPTPELLARYAPPAKEAA